ncbi:MBL fold metallo-hydrolase [Paenibacillus arenilitoris]|uniref:MBL fold metallo-hydrolase n=1 Tax=Paenibacillus arenilitoris TaxID=2772299 RepID=A0A927CKV1_9BACL|nr:MBL fold metallo-hydrolase [Paenibacillus arenilitoris]MBD2868041.1 MBL fold metallo-hydrolase [Paenibacillus arenilitoris]
MRFVREKTIVQLTYLPNLFPVNCYLVEEEDGLTLVDAALPNNAKAIMEAAGRIGKPIARIVLTHAHGDHIGALDGLKRMNPSAQVFISARDARLLSGDLSLVEGEPDTPIRGGVPKAGAIRTKPDVLLQDGDRIGSLLAVAAPGHTPGSMAFLDTRTDALIAGDAFQTRPGVAVTGQMKLLFPFPAMATWDKRTGLQSARRLRDLNPSLLAAGHGSMVKQPGRAVDGAIAAAERALGE